MARRTWLAFAGLVALSVGLGALLQGCETSGRTRDAAADDSLAGLTGAELARARLAQWRRAHPDREWVVEEKSAHTIMEPADNSDLLGPGGQNEGDTYGSFTKNDLLIWSREAEKLVVEGSRIFHSADLLGGTVGVSCDMCHPDGANTHPETYPKYQVQMGRVALLRDMINWCLEHPVRGKAMDPDDPRMRALEAYILAQRKGVALNYGRH